jgi:hypothetical protein
MAFRSAADAADSRRAVAALMGLAQREGIFAATTEHFDLTPGVEGRAPLVLNRHGVMVPAPDLVLINLAQQMVVGVEVETRTLARCYPGATFADMAKLATNMEIDLGGAAYVRTVKGSDYDASASWRQRDIPELLRALAAGELHHFREGLLILHPADLRRLDELWARMRGSPA